MVTMWLRISFWTVSALCRAFLMRIRGGRATVVLPPCESERIEAKWFQQDPGRVIRLIDRFQRVMVLRTKHRCFYQSYSRAVTLRKLGVPVVLNLGLRNLGAKTGPGVRGHCWITVGDKPLFERKVWEMYPVLLAETPAGVRYWAGQNDPPLRKRKRIRTAGQSCPA